MNMQLYYWLMLFFVGGVFLVAVIYAITTVIDIIRETRKSKKDSKQ